MIFDEFKKITSDQELHLQGPHHLKLRLNYLLMNKNIVQGLDSLDSDISIALWGTLEFFLLIETRTTTHNSN